MTDSDEVKLLPTLFRLCGGDDYRTLLEVDLRDGSVTGEIEDAGEAAKVFVENVRNLLSRPPVVTDEVVERVAKIIDPIWMDPPEGPHVLENYPGHADYYRERARERARAAIAAMPAVVSGLQSMGDHALPPSGLSQSSLSQAKPAAAIARKKP